MSKRSKTITFPRYSLKQCEDWLKDIDPAKKLSKSKLSELQGFSTDVSMSATSARAAMLMFGLMNYDQGEYELSDLGRILRSSVSTNQLSVLRVLVLLYPEKLREIYGLLVGKTWDSDSYVGNLVFQEYTITDKVAKQFEHVFCNSYEHCGILRTNKNGKRYLLETEHILTSYEINFNSFDAFQSSVLKIVKDESKWLGFNQQLFGVIDSNANDTELDVEVTKGVSTHELPDMTKSIEGEKPMVIFRLSDGEYVVSKTDLVSFIRQKGRQVNGNSYELE